jgi:hypothetical protein
MLTIVTSGFQMTLPVPYLLTEAGDFLLTEDSQYLLY